MNFRKSTKTAIYERFYNLKQGGEKAIDEKIEPQSPKFTNVC